jgi:hypothetical protein
MSRIVYGVTTVPQRRDTLLPRTLASLRAGGFPTPRLFVDGDDRPENWKRFGLETTLRFPKIRTFGNFALGLVELYLRDPTADMYAMFQDDFVTYRNLRGYLERCTYPPKGYFNLYTFPSNQGVCGAAPGWYESRCLSSSNKGLRMQSGRGAVALLFPNDAVVALFTSLHFVERPKDAHRGHRSIDGGIVASLNKAGFREYVSFPSLCQHIGDVSSMGNKQHKKSECFWGESFDAMRLLAMSSQDAASKRS